MLVETLSVTLDVDAASLDGWHPLVAFLQLMAEAVDPINYAHLWFHAPRDGRPRHVMLTMGTDDDKTPAFTTAALASAGRVPILEPVVWPSDAHALRGIDSVVAPAAPTRPAEAGRR